MKNLSNAKKRRVAVWVVYSPDATCMVYLPSLGSKLFSGWKK